MNGWTRQDLDDLVALRAGFEKMWDEAYAAGKLDRCDDLMVQIRQMSSQIAQLTQSLVNG